MIWFQEQRCEYPRNQSQLEPKRVVWVPKEAETSVGEVKDEVRPALSRPWIKAGQITFKAAGLQCRPPAFSRPWASLLLISQLFFCSVLFYSYFVVLAFPIGYIWSFRYCLFSLCYLRKENTLSVRTFTVVWLIENYSSFNSIVFLSSSWYL